MRIWFSGMVLSGLLFWAGVAAAGVILQEEQVATQGSATRRGVRTIALEGHRGKVVNEGFTIVVDFDKARTLMIHPGQKAYYETPFPPPELLRLMITNAIVPPMVDYQKTGKQRKILGYQCDEYSGSKQYETVAYYDLACFSTQPPGAKDYEAFMRGLIAKFDRDRKKPLSKIAIPAGIPLETQATIVTGFFKPRPATPGKPATPGASKTPPATPGKPATPEASKTPPEAPPAKAPPQPQVRERTEIIRITVTSIKAQSISSAEFDPPAGYVKNPAPAVGLGH